VVFGLAHLLRARGDPRLHHARLVDPLGGCCLGERLTARKLLGLALAWRHGLLVWDENPPHPGRAARRAVVLGAAFSWAIGTNLQRSTRCARRSRP